jgi:hypothetical protein
VGESKRCASGINMTLGLLPLDFEEEVVEEEEKYKKKKVLIVTTWSK